jgi:hypothetical protein
MNLQRTILGTKAPLQQLGPGVWLDRIQSGGRHGPKGEVRSNVIGGQVWNDLFTLGSKSDAFQLLVPDIRLPPNQYWPLHWHDCWVAVIILEGSCLIGDWLMNAGDVLITAAELEYGPLVIGPEGCQMFEIFAKLHLHGGGYAPEYRDHPTLQGTRSVFRERGPLNQRNIGRQVLPIEGTAGLTKGRLTHGAQWDLGEPSDPSRGVLRSTHLAAGEQIGVHRYDDWHAIFFLDGSARLGTKELTRHDVLIVEPRAVVAEIEVGPDGARWLEVARTASGAERRLVPASAETATPESMNRRSWTPTTELEGKS